MTIVACAPERPDDAERPIGESDAMRRPVPHLEENDSALPDMNQFILLDTEPTWDQADLQRRIRFPAGVNECGITGTVAMRVLLDRRGCPLETHLDRVDVKGADRRTVTRAVEEAILATSFTPGLIQGKPVACWLEIPILLN